MNEAPLHADDALKYPGSRLKTEDAIAQSITVFVGKVTKAGESGPIFNVWYTTFNNLQVRVLQPYRGKPSAQVAVSLSVAGDEVTPKVGNSYIFFGSSVVVCKLLPATDANIVLVKKLIVETPAK